VAAYGRRKDIEDASDGEPAGFDGAHGRLAEKGLEPVESQLDRVMGWAAGREESELGASGAD
jgi:hypothetical protein